MSAKIPSSQAGTEKKQTLHALAAAALIMVAAGGIFYWISRAYVLEKAEANVTNLLLSHKGIHHYVQNTMLPAYSQYQTDSEIPADFYAPELLSSSFIVRNQHTFYNQERKAAGLAEVYYKLAATNPRNPVNKADALEEQLIRMFNENREVKSYREIIEVDGRETLYVALPFLENQPRCMRCHGKRQDSPPQLQQRYPGEGGFNEKVGEIRAITSIRSPLEHEYVDVYIFVSALSVGFMALASLFFFNARLRTLVEQRTLSLEEEIEERKQAEATLRENRATLKQILDTVPQSIFWKDVDSVYLGCNQLFAQAVGVDDPGQIKGKNDFDLPWPRAEAEAYRADDREVIQANQAKRHIIEPLQQADGTRLWIDTSKVPLLDAQGTIYGVLGVYEDITEQKRAKEEKEELERRLSQSQKMESIGTLAGGVAHDFNNILAVILGYTELAMIEDDPDRRAQDLEQVRMGGERAKELVKQILAFSRRTDEPKHPIQVSLIIKEALKMLRSSIPTTIEIRQHITSHATVLADPTQIHQIVMNLCVNAYHAMRETGGVLAIFVGEVDLSPKDEGDGTLTPGRYLQLEVSDTGGGIAPEIQDKVFEPYFTTKKTGEGTGLGLAVVHGIVESHHGHITVSSQPGSGTSFHVYLPLVEHEPVTLPGAEVVENISGTGERVLVVDDEVQLTEITKRHLAQNGYRVTTFTQAGQALQAFHSHPDQFDLIITDMTMPLMTGADFAQQVLAIRPEMPIILCTGQSEIINRAKAYALGIGDYLSKPVSKHDLLVAVRKALERNNPLS